MQQVAVRMTTGLDEDLDVTGVGENREVVLGDVRRPSSVGATPGMPPAVSRGDHGRGTAQSEVGRV